MIFKSIIGATYASLAIVSFSVEAALVSRLGGLAYYDTEANLTWLADANYAQTNGDHQFGSMTWVVAQNWVTGLNVAGVTGWRLPDTIDVGDDGATYTNINNGVDFGYNITAHSELSNMYYNVLGNSARFTTSGIFNIDICVGQNLCLTNTGPFSNLRADRYWSATELAPLTLSAWTFDMNSGWQGTTGKYIDSYAWAVHDGDVAPSVPVPAAVWLFGSGLIGLIGLARRKKT